MNPARLHLLLNHIPPLGVLGGAVLLAAGRIAASRDLVRAGLAFIVMAALAALPVYFSGEPAAEFLQPVLAGADPLIERHEEAAELAFAGIAALGIAALAGLRRDARGRLSLRTLDVLLVLALLEGGALLRAAHLGGGIRHSEARDVAGTGAPEVGR